MMAGCGTFVSIPLALAFVLLNVSVCTCVTVTFPSKSGVLDKDESENIYRALQNMVYNVNHDIHPDREYSAGRLFTELVDPKIIRVNAKSVLIRHTRWSSECSVSMSSSDTTEGKELLEALKQLLPIIRPYVMKGYEWVTLSNHTDWIDYYVMSGEKESSLPLADAPAYKILSDVGSSVTDCAIKPYMLLSDSAVNQMHPGDTLLSPDGKYKLTIPGPPLLGAPCVLILEDKDGHIVFQTDYSAPQRNCYLALSSDGTLELWNMNKRIWKTRSACSSETKCAGAASLAVKDGEIKLYRSVDDYLSLYFTVPSN